MVIRLFDDPRPVAPACTDRHADLMAALDALAADPARVRLSSTASWLDAEAGSGDQ